MFLTSIMDCKMRISAFLLLADLINILALCLEQSPKSQLFRPSFHYQSPIPNPQSLFA